MTSIKQKFTVLTLALVAAQLLFFTSGCGYSNPRTRIATFDKDGDGKIRLFLDMWSNQTNLLGFQGYIKQGLIRELTRSNRFHLTQNKARADYILNGTIYSVEIPGLSYGAFDRAIQVRAEVKLGYRLQDTKTGKIVFQKEKYIKRGTFNVGSDAVQTQSNQDIALLALTKSLAGDIDIQLYYFFISDDISKGGKEFIPTDDIETLD